MAKKLTAADFISKAKLVHGNKYDYSKVEYINSRTKVIIICPIHGEFRQIPTDHLRGVGCRYCGYSQVADKNRKSKTSFIDEANRIHIHKYSYEKVEYINNKTPVTIICPIHGEFTQTPNDHLIGCGCQKCYDERRGLSLRKDQEKFISEAKKIHGDKYDYSQVKYINNKTKIQIICREHGVFPQTPDMHLRGDGCPLCRNIARRKLLYGVAYYDVLESMVKNEEYIMSTRYWHSMLRRCYSDKVHNLQPTYIGCSVCQEWHLFSNFKKWFDEHYVEGWCLDKDILVKGNKVYSPETCCFVPNEINIIFSHKKRRMNLPRGVTLNKKGKYVARARIYGRETRIGQFSSSEEAFNAYKIAKEKWIKIVADKWKDQLDPKVYDALYNYQVEITD